MEGAIQAQRLHSMAQDCRKQIRTDATVTEREVLDALAKGLPPCSTDGCENYALRQNLRCEECREEEAEDRLVEMVLLVLEIA